MSVTTATKRLTQTKVYPLLRPHVISRASSNMSTPAATAHQQASRETTKPKANPFELGGRREEFKKREASRPPFESSKSITMTKAPSPGWKYGEGPNDKSKSNLKHIEIDPNGKDRAMISNYKLLISGVPRPISFVSTISADGQSRNLAPFSYFQVIDHDPPIFVIGFSGRATRPKDTRRNLVETGECVISVVSEHMIEAVNATSLDVPYETSEWEISGFEPAPSATVRPERVKDAIFSIEGKLLQMIDLDYDGKHKAEGKPAGGLALIEAKRFWVREDALNDARDEIKLDVMRPLVQLGGISYGRVGETFELPRPKLQDELDNEENGLSQILDNTGENK